MRTEHKNQIETALEAVKSHKGITNIYFVACGGSQAVLMSGQYIFDKETDLPSQVYTANEFIYETPKSLGEHSLVISCSHSGNTPETVEATKLARQRGALTICLSNEVESPLWKEAEYGVHYDWGQEVDDSDKNKGILYGLLFSLLNYFEPSEKWNVCLKDLEQLTELSTKTKQLYEERAVTWAKSHKRDELIYVMGSGLNYGEVYSTALCWFMEMQWIQSCPIHTGDYFHGPFEITDYDVPFLLVKSIGKTRHLDQRAEDFAVKYTDKLEVLDQSELPLDTVSEAGKQYIAAILSGVAIRHYVEKIAFERGHSLDVRRYMWQMEY
ncbi:SIS domain-containing protein [Erysipelothrix sp. HDW6A]|uniref:SIS domain-containing protein n=1 Tax=Erysipelothrix sp. HDW6A TaxID=2714928 RepID=UPI00140828B1|nr:SIS domain-containing protein [Erysipelothrix sp. HDW6A]QIK57945.1 SIS domain-containing protein [Erysipelothrix sp. HDW6A]QIK57947.1 SIS domain-containing protein [Erysipelothrix sp. HDW6A]